MHLEGEAFQCLKKTYKKEGEWPFTQADSEKDKG